VFRQHDVRRRSHLRPENIHTALQRAGRAAARGCIVEPAAAGMILAPIVNIIAVRQMAARSALVRHCNPAIPRARATDGRHISPRRAASARKIAENKRSNYPGAGGFRATNWQLVCDATRARLPTDRPPGHLQKA